MAQASLLWKPIVDFALPPRCPVCGVTVERDHRFCVSCWQKLKILSRPWCAACGKPFSFERPEGSVCAECLVSPPNHDGVRAVVAYDQTSAVLPMQLKYGSRLGIARLIAERLGRFVAELPTDSLIVPVPLHRWRIFSRGFNQSVLIARWLSKNHQLPMRNDIIFRKRATPPLQAMTAKQRQKTVRKAFELRAGISETVAGKTIVLVDDVYTSGSTTNACAKLLKRAGAGKILVFCWARVLHDDDRN